ncbi:MAG: hypothetical protein ACI837_001171 [Crocinitomicaceae bacterium]|jgi:hypothetical protein
MKSILFIVLLLGAVGTTNAAIVEEWTPPYSLVSSKLDPTLNAGTSVYEFKFLNVTSGSHRIIYSVDGVAFTKNINSTSIIISSEPGKHIFQFYYGPDYAEVYTDSILILDKYHNTYEVTLWISEIIMSVDKPVIYLYPEKETNVSVQMDIQGETTFTYPPLNGSWDFVAQPNGDLQFGDHTYNYLFWEARQRHQVNPAEEMEGFNVEKNDVVSFLEDKLNQAGLTSKEQADFITYWGPRLSAHELTFVHFEFNEECDRYAKMAISPQPDNIYRIYMSWTSIDEPMNVSAQKIEKMNRSGFTVLEWGGFKVNQPQSVIANLLVK